MFLSTRPASSIANAVLRLAKTGSLRESRYTPISQVPWTCRECRSRSNLGGSTVGDGQLRSLWSFQRQFSSTAWRRDERSRGPPRTPIEHGTSFPPSHAEPDTPASSLRSLPSRTAERRSDISKQASRMLDTLLARASVASQQINAYTGTDYSGIEALRKEITEQEQRVRDLHSTVDEARTEHHEAYNKQTFAQREIVALLERKSSWSPSDLERYMSLVRSEHLNDQDVQNTKENLAIAERELEEARSLLEKLERKQYHEEQIWSDTIRRNSTWVTFGLMGLNILLLLAQITIFEPYRRKKVVRDVKQALDEKTLTAVPSLAEIEKQVDEAVTPGNIPLEEVEDGLKSSINADVPIYENSDGTIPLSNSTVVSVHAADAVERKPTNEADSAYGSGQLSMQSTQVAYGNEVSKSTWNTYQEAIRDLFSERLVQMRKIDVTKTALQGAATGVAIMGSLFVLLRPK